MANCRVHGLALKSGSVPIRYGYPPPPPKNYFEACEALFPNAKSFVVGGCVIDDKRTQRVRYCPECRDAEARWLMVNSEPDNFWSV